MSRVSHKVFIKRLNEERSKITDAQFFTSRLLAGHFEEMAAIQTRRYGQDRRVRVLLDWNPLNPERARTNNKEIYINAGNDLIQSIPDRLQRYFIVCGLFSHELGHVRFTDFVEMHEYITSLIEARWYPTKPKSKKKKEREAEEDIWTYAAEDELNLRAVVEVAKDIFNILEDGYIEIQMLNAYPGSLGRCLKKLRNLQCERMLTLTQLKEAEAEGECLIWNSVRDCILSYVKFGQIKYGEETTQDERVQAVFQIIPLLDDALFSTDIKERFRAANLILIHCWEYIKAYCEVKKEQYKQEQGFADIGKLIENDLSKKSGGSTIGEGDTSPDEAPAPQESKEGAEKRKETHQDAGLKADDEENEDEESKQEVPIGGLSSMDARQNAVDEEAGRIPYHKTDSILEGEGGDVEYNDGFEEKVLENVARDIEKILEHIAEEQASEELEEERLQELNSMAQDISYGEAHVGVNIVINRVISVDEANAQEYERIAPKLLELSKQLQRGIAQRLRECRRSSKQTGLAFGRRLSSHSLYRQDCKMFYKTKRPIDSNLAVGLVVDESGSMGGKQRCTSARATAIILEDFCRNLDVPITIYGHTTGYREKEGDYENTVELYSYVEFDNFDDEDKYRLMNISSRSGNRDGAALRFVAERLMQRSEPKKLLMIISDGQPNDTGYSGSAAEQDLREIKREYQRKGVLFLAAAIGDDKENIGRIYGDAFLDITDLHQLPEKLTNEIKRHLRV